MPWIDTHVPMMIVLSKSNLPKKFDRLFVADPLEIIICQFLTGAATLRSNRPKSSIWASFRLWVD